MSHHKIINDIAHAYLADTRTRLLHAAQWLEQRSESPIEIIMGMRLMVLLRSGDGLNLGYWNWDEGAELVFRGSLQYNQTNLGIVPQLKVGKYRVDFGVFYGVGSEIRRIAIECDGHDFHERTKAQAQRDKSRDRVLQARAIPVFRFTGSEIYANSPNLLDSVGSFLWAQINGLEGENDAA